MIQGCQLFLNEKFKYPNEFTGAQEQVHLPAGLRLQRLRHMELQAKHEGRRRRNHSTQIATFPSTLL